VPIIDTTTREGNKMITYKIAERTNEGGFIRIDLPTFKSSIEGYDFIACELLDFDYAMFYVTPVETA